MSIFGKYAILGEAEHHFQEEPELSWKVKPVTSGMELELSKFMLHNRIYRTNDGRQVELPPTWLENAYREIALSFGGTNIPKFEDQPVSSGGEAILPKDAPIEEVEKVLQMMPQPMVMEIWKAVGKAYPKWGPVDPNAV
jgi:hypothetical protein